MTLFIHVYRTMELLQHMYLNLNYVQNVIQSIIPIISFQVITSPKLILFRFSPVQVLIPSYYTI